MQILQNMKYLGVAKLDYTAAEFSYENIRSASDRNQSIGLSDSREASVCYRAERALGTRSVGMHAGEVHAVSVRRTQSKHELT